MTSELDEWAEEWDLVLRAGDLAEGTRVVYLRGVRQFIVWLHNCHAEAAEPRQVTDRHALKWAEHLKIDRQLAKATRRLRLIALTLWFDYLVKQSDSGVPSNPFDEVELPQPDQVPPDILPDNELAALLATCKGGDFVDRRDEAVLRLLLDTGVRRAELVGIDLDNLDLAHQEATVTGKGGKTRIAPFGTKTTLALRKYLRARGRRQHATDPSLFQSVRVHATGEVRLTAAGVNAMIDRRCKQAGLGHRRPHQIRHTWAHDMLDNGAQESDVERLGGWAPGSKMVKWYGSAQADTRARKRARSLSRGDRV
ncbi:MAG: hypothetical protein QOF58_648 [Pseudonocardiales bacterium]|nr:hypothetical protein [Pseudonocardiales bacterium]